MYTIENNKAKKVLHITVAGLFKEEEAKSYIKDYQASVKLLQPSGYTLVIDGSGQTTVPQTIGEDMQNAVNLYESSGFKQVIIVMPSSAIASMQVKRLKMSDKTVVVKTAAEAKELLK